MTDDRKTLLARKALLALKDRALTATREGDGAFYQDYLSEDAVAVVPFGVFDKQTIVAQMAAGGAFRSVGIDDTQVMMLSADSGLITYRARFDDRPSVFVTTVYARRNGRWQGVFYQQTALGVPAAAET